VFGGSSAEGWPHAPNVSFPRFIRRQLEVLNPSKKIEVINLGFSAINSNFFSDIIEDVIEQDPDLILIYAGHNEYYGALGVASNDLTSSPGSVKIILTLRELKIYELIGSFIESLTGMISDPGTGQGSRTLMEAMAGENLIDKDSDSFNMGIEQFRSNISDVLITARDAGVPVIVGKVVSNIQHKPLDSIIDEEGEANKAYLTAETEIGNGDRVNAVSNYILAKESDRLRFRAPEKINLAIDELCELYGMRVVKIDSLFSAESNLELPPAELFVDHLHPTIEGYRLIAEGFLAKMSSKKLNLKINTQLANPKLIDYLKDNVSITRLDSSFSEYRLNVLLNSFPFNRSTDPLAGLRSVKPGNRADSMALMIVRNKVGWNTAHEQLAGHYLDTKNYSAFYYEINSQIEDKPFEISKYKFGIDNLFENKEFALAGNLLHKLHHRYPDFYSAKRLGIVYMELKDYKNSVKYFNESLNYSKLDATVYFNLSKAFFELNQFDDAMINLEKCLEIENDYPNAKRILESLKQTKSGR
jgi:hypothetical protein